MSTPHIVIADYGAGNLLSVARALAASGAEAEVTGDPQRIATADRLVLPGVGAFGDCMTAFLARGLRAPVLEFVATGRPMLGLCVGMQLLFERSTEFGHHEGLGIIPGEVHEIPKHDAEGRPHKTPHIGWTDLQHPGDTGPASWDKSLLKGLPGGTSMYFLHSFAAWPTNPANRLADARFNGHLIAAAVTKDNVTGTQFHPEKSGAAGLALLRNFLEI